MKSFARANSLVGAVLVLAAIMSGACFAQEKAKFELLHLWAEKVEAHALSAFSEPMRSANVEWNEHVVHTNFKGIRKTFSDRLAHGVPPTATFWIGGGNAVSKLIDQGFFTVINPTVEITRFSERLIPEVYDAVRFKDGLSVLPVGIHLQNFAVYNRPVLEKLNESVPATWDDFIRIAEKAKQAGITPLSISDQPWQLRFLLGAMIVGNLEPKEMQALASGGAIGDSQKRAIRSAFNRLDQLRPYINADYRDLNWAKAVDHVVQGRAMAHMLGDFVVPLLANDSDFICALPPGNRYVTWSFDSIALVATQDPTELRGQGAFVDTVLNSQNAVEYISRKGGVPVTADFDTSSLSGCAKVSILEWKRSPARVRLMSQEWTQSMVMIANFGHDYLNNPDIGLESIIDNLFKSLESLRVSGSNE